MKKICIKLIAISIACIMLLSTVGLAVSNSEINKQKDQQKEIKNEINEKKDELEEIQEQKSETIAEVDNLTDKISSVQEEIDELDSQVDELNNSIKESEQKLSQAQKDYSKQEQLLNERLVSMYEAGDTTYLDILLSSDDFTDLISNWFLASELASYDTDMLEKIENQKKEIEDTKNKLEANKSQLQVAKTSKQSKTNELKQAKEEKNKKVAALSSEEKQIQEQLQELQEYNAKISKEIKAAEERYKKQLEELKKQEEQNKNNGGSMGGSVNTGKGTFIKPVNSGSITAGWRYSSGALHAAVDYGVPVGTPVYASAAGVVIKTANLSYSYGTYVVVQHTNGMQTWYAHGSSLKVSEGQTVSQGQLIMLSGNSGNSHGAHLHFEMRTSPYNYGSSSNPGNRVNPLNYLK